MAAKDHVFKEKSREFLEYLKSVGDIVDACTMVELDESTIVKWRKQYDDFDRAVESAFEQFRDTLPIVLKNEARRQLANAVFGRNAIVNSRITSRYNASGELIERIEVIDTIAQGAQRWAVERVLDEKKVTSAEQALKLLADLGYLPKTLTEKALNVLDSKDAAIQELFTEYYPDTVTETHRGISDEMANAIKHQILGTNELAPMETIDVEAQ